MSLLFPTKNRVVHKNPRISNYNYIHVCFIISNDDIVFFNIVRCYEAVAAHAYIFFFFGRLWLEFMQNVIFAAV